MSDGEQLTQASGQDGSPPFGPSNGWAASLMAKLDAEIVETYNDQANARDHAEWNRYYRLEGQRTGLIQAKMWLKETQPNDPSSATRRTGRVDCNLDAMAGFAAAHG